MKILLQVPLPSLLDLPPRLPDLGLGYLAKALINQDHNVILLSWNSNMDGARYTRFLKDSSPDAVGIKVFTKDVKGAFDTLNLAKRALPDCITLVGGPHVSAESPEEIFVDFPAVDYAFQGEAEEGLPMLLSLLAKNPEDSSRDDALSSIPGLVWKNHGEVKSNPPHFKPDLDEIGAPAWHLQPLKDFDHCRLGKGENSPMMLPIAATRGCPGRCSFCCAACANGLKVRARSPDNILKEITDLRKIYRIKHLMITDTNFTFYQDLLLEFCRRLEREKLDITFGCPTGPDLGMLTEDTLRAMKRAGCEYIGIGVESASFEGRRQIKKGHSLGQIEEITRRASRLGIAVQGFFMLGFPGETLEEMKESIRFAFRHDFLPLHFEILYPLPGTQVYETLKSMYHVDRIDWKTFDVHRSPYPLSVLSSEDLNRLLKKTRLKTWYHPRLVLSKIKKRIRRPYGV
jgi:anaerobic magnesium-protoporphyrin IX monomethyl ester cyclase